jgi:hypothetical protein
LAAGCVRASHISVSGPESGMRISRDQ